VNVANIPLEDIDVITARIYGEHGYPHEAWTRLRREAPVHWSAPGLPTVLVGDQARRHHGGVHAAGQVPQRRPLHSVPGSGRSRRAEPGGRPTLRMLVNMDPPSTAPTASSSATGSRHAPSTGSEQRLVEITRDLFDELAKDGGEYTCDFVVDIAARQPLRMITEMLGIPRRARGLPS